MPLCNRVITLGKITVTQPTPRSLVVLASCFNNINLTVLILMHNGIMIPRNLALHNRSGGCKILPTILIMSWLSYENWFTVSCFTWEHWSGRVRTVFLCKSEALFGFYFPFVLVALRFMVILLLWEMSSTATGQLARGCLHGGVSVEASRPVDPKGSRCQEKSQSERARWHPE